MIKIAKSDDSKSTSSIEQITREMAKNLSAKYINSERTSYFADLME